MTHSEYIAVAISIVLSFAVLRLLDALPHVAARESENERTHRTIAGVAAALFAALLVLTFVGLIDIDLRQE